VYHTSHIKLIYIDIDKMKPKKIIVINKKRPPNQKTKRQKTKRIITLIRLSQNKLSQNDCENDHKNVCKKILPISQQQLANIIYKHWSQYKKNLCQSLDANFSYYLLGGESSWNDVLFRNIINIHYYLVNETSSSQLINSWWNIEFLLEFFSNSLNESYLNNPKPIKPFDPFNKHEYNWDTLRRIYLRARELHLFVNINYHCLMTFLLNKEESCIKNHESMNKFYSSLKHQNIIDIFTHVNLRCKVTDQLDSQNNHKIIWVSRDEPLDYYEEAYLFFNSLALTDYRRRMCQILFKNTSTQLYLPILIELV